MGDRRADDLPAGRGARCRNAGTVRAGEARRLDVRADVPPALVSGLPGAADVRDAHVRALDLGAGRALRAGAAGIFERADRQGPSGGVVSTAAPSEKRGVPRGGTMLRVSIWAAALAVALTGAARAE